jgi:hypothetical protein
MKTIKNKNSGELSRVNDTQADINVASGRWIFCSKEEWKKATRKVAVEKPIEKTSDKKH